MEIQVLRQEYTPKSTIGQMLIDGRFECFTLEDRVRPVKIPRETAIPAGRYEVVVNMSNRFKVRMPLLLNVPNFEGVRIHNGNTHEHTDGCILVGASKSQDFIGNSKVTFAALMKKLEAAAAREKIFIDVVDEGVPLPADRAARGMPPGAGLGAARAVARKKAGATQPAAKKAVAKKAAAKKPVAKKPVAKKAATKQPAPKKAVRKSPAPKRAETARSSAKGTTKAGLPRQRASKQAPARPAARPAGTPKAPSAGALFKRR